jgi:hypothetical protein
VTNRKSNFTIDLLSSVRLTRRWFPHLFHKKNYWQVVSGNWRFEHPPRLVSGGKSDAKAPESIIKTGSRLWTSLTYDVKLKLPAASCRESSKCKEVIPFYCSSLANPVRLRRTTGNALAEAFPACATSVTTLRKVGVSSTSYSQTAEITILSTSIFLSRRLSLSPDIMVSGEF